MQILLSVSLIPPHVLVSSSTVPSPTDQGSAKRIYWNCYFTRFEGLIPEICALDVSLWMA